MCRCQCFPILMTVDIIRGRWVVFTPKEPVWTLQTTVLSPSGALDVSSWRSTTRRWVRRWCRFNHRWWTETDFKNCPPMATSALFIRLFLKRDLLFWSYRAVDFPMQLNMALFEFNGRTGYILKHDVLRRSDKKFDPFTDRIDTIIASTLTIKVTHKYIGADMKLWNKVPPSNHWCFLQITDWMIWLAVDLEIIICLILTNLSWIVTRVQIYSGQFLSDKNVKTGVEVELIGLPKDPKRKYRTKWSPTPNAINPEWNEEPFVFEKVSWCNLLLVTSWMLCRLHKAEGLCDVEQILLPEMAYLRLVVQEEGGKFIGHRIIPLDSLQTGETGHVQVLHWILVVIRNEAAYFWLKRKQKHIYDIKVKILTY